MWRQSAVCFRITQGSGICGGHYQPIYDCNLCIKLIEANFNIYQELLLFFAITLMSSHNLFINQWKAFISYSILVIMAVICTCSNTIKQLIYPWERMLEWNVHQYICRHRQSFGFFLQYLTWIFQYYSQSGSHYRLLTMSSFDWISI